MNEKNIRKEERDNFTIVLEDLRSDFRMFGEALDFVRQKGEATFEEVGKVKIEMGIMKEDIVGIKEDIVEIKEDIVEMKGDIKEINTRLDRIEIEVKSLRKDFDLIKEQLTDKVSMSYFKKFEERLIKVEKKLELQVT